VLACAGSSPGGAWPRSVRVGTATTALGATTP